MMQSKNEPLVVGGLKGRVVRPLREGAQLPRVLSLLVRLEPAEVDVTARERKPASSMRDDSMLFLVSDQSPKPSKKCKPN